MTRKRNFSLGFRLEAALLVVDQGDTHKQSAENMITPKARRYLQGSLFLFGRNSYQMTA
jgi:hypothetical protein